MSLIGGSCRFQRLARNETVFTYTNRAPDSLTPWPRMDPVAAPITQLLERWKQGDRSVENALIAEVYPILRSVAASQIRRVGGHLTLGATELAHEAYMNLQRQQRVDWQNRDQFFAIAATVVRRVLIDYLRERNAGKRAGGKLMIALDDVHAAELSQPSDIVDWIALDQALTKLEALDADVARVVELKLFSVLSADRIADSCQSSVATVGRQWRFAKSWLAKELNAPSIEDAI
jgi:RNA polymerase sigma factor (TIGR02999 family)